MPGTDVAYPMPGTDVAFPEAQYWRSVYGATKRYAISGTDVVRTALRRATAYQELPGVHRLRARKPHLEILLLS
eukprot:3588800-Rhodomonas_salina.1